MLYFAKIAKLRQKYYSAIFDHKNVHTMHFLFVLKLLFEKKGGEIFGDHNMPSGDQKFILDRQLAPILKS